MNEINGISSGLKAMLEKAEKMGWSSNVWKESFHNDTVYVEMGQYSPSGEDFFMSIDFDKDNQVQSFLRNLRAYYESFDIDEHVMLWVESRGENGCPSSIRALVEDAEAIKNMIGELAVALENIGHGRCLRR